jgi:hypothetical protein
MQTVAIRGLAVVIRESQICKTLACSFLQLQVVTILVSVIGVQS